MISKSVTWVELIAWFTPLRPYWASLPLGQGFDPCDDWPHPHARPRAPIGEDHNVWYRGWEVGYNPDAVFWGGTGWVAYKGGCDLDAPCVYGETYAICLDEIDEEEDEG